ncbi:hypothetical protein [Nocardia asiatica]|uniref:hypothetical protein n=1 Tax=Nocardia asiatica TaxID=209252 RepID=UPI0024567301|nr:hypothetical protein [Nocardia asiatica]
MPALNLIELALIRDTVEDHAPDYEPEFGLPHDQWSTDHIDAAASDLIGDHLEALAATAGFTAVHTATTNYMRRNRPALDRPRSQRTARRREREELAESLRALAHQLSASGAFAQAGHFLARAQRANPRAPHWDHDRHQIQAAHQKAHGSPAHPAVSVVDDGTTHDLWTLITMFDDYTDHEHNLAPLLQTLMAEDRMWLHEHEQNQFITWATEYAQRAEHNASQAHTTDPTNPPPALALITSARATIDVLQPLHALWELGPDLSRVDVARALFAAAVFYHRHDYADRQRRYDALRTAADLDGHL